MSGGLNGAIAVGTKLMKLELLKETFAIARLPSQSSVPGWADGGGELVSITRTRDELSIVCPDARVPMQVKAERSWKAFKVQGPLDFLMIGILSHLSSILAQAEISLFALSTFDTDYLLVKRDQASQAANALRDAGHEILGDSIVGTSN